MKAKFPGFKKCMAMMRKRDPLTKEDGFHWLLPHAGEYVHELIEEFGKEKDHGLRCWLLELLASAKSSEAFDFLAEQLRSEDWRFRIRAIQGLNDLDTNEARTLLWQARAFTFGSPEETAEFLTTLGTIVNKHADKKHG